MKKHPRPQVSLRKPPLLDHDKREPVSVRPHEWAIGSGSAKPEVVAESELDTPEEGLDPTLPENPVHGAPGHQVKEPSSEDEDDEGRSVTEQLIDEGAKEAEQDKVNQGTRAGVKNDRSKS